PPGAATVVVLMALARRAALAHFLRGAGWPAGTPAAIVLGAGTSRAWTWTGTLSELGQGQVPDASAGAPGTLVVGDGVSLCSRIGALARPGDLAPAAGQVPD